MNYFFQNLNFRPGCGSDSQGASGDTSGGTSGGTAKKLPLKSQEESEPVPGSRQDVGHQQGSQEERQRKAVSGSPKAKQQSGGTGAVSHHSPPTAAKLSTTPAAATPNNLSCNDGARNFFNDGVRNSHTPSLQNAASSGKPRPVDKSCLLDVDENESNEASADHQGDLRSTGKRLNWVGEKQ